MWDSILGWFSEPGIQQLLLGIAIAFVAGAIIGGWTQEIRKERGKSAKNKGDKAFFKGIQYILSNDHDQDIEEFTKSVQINSETIETYVALGNLYRSKGDIDRAIRIRHSIILRPNIDEHIKLGTLFDLGLDYRKGGFLSRALNTFLKVAQENPDNIKALEEIERIYEELKDWKNAYRTRQKIARLSKGDHRHILAHHLVEMGKVHQQKGDLAKAMSIFNEAISSHKECVDAYLHLGGLYFSKQQHKKAISTWEKIVKVAPHFMFLAYRYLEGAYSEMKNLKPVENFLKECARSNSDAFTHMALSRYLYNENDLEGALKEIDSALELAPSFWEARKFKGEMLLAHGREKEALADYEELIESLDVSYLKFQCSQCGFEPNELQWQCPQCKKWDTIQLIDSTKARPTAAPQNKDALPQLPADVKEE